MIRIEDDALARVNPVWRLPRPPPERPSNATNHVVGACAARTLSAASFTGADDAGEPAQRALRRQCRSLRGSGEQHQWRLLRCGHGHDQQALVALRHERRRQAGTPGTYWKFYKNSGSGFVKTSVNYPVPASGTADGFATITAADGNKQWTLVDIDGDARLDLVQTADPATGDVWGLGPTRRGPGSKDDPKPHWKVYRGQP
jgi:hypothetical protein